LIGKSFAGIPFEGEVKLGECVRIMTGAATGQTVLTAFLCKNKLKSMAMLLRLKVVTAKMKMCVTLV